jgi:cyclopropane fatty-acyl-phospholipid synthase-like methyltransferase
LKPTGPLDLFSARSEQYARFVRFVRYPQGIREYFVSSSLLAPHLRVLDAGCGTGVVTLALRDALVRRGFELGTFQGFDLTPAMIERFRATLRKRGIEDVQLERADVLELGTLPESWRDYDLVVSASMFEYLPRARLSAGLAELRSLLKEGGRFVLFVTRRNWLTRPLIGRWWQSNLYGKEELRKAFEDAGFSSIRFGRFPARARHLSLWGHVVESQKGVDRDA